MSARASPGERVEIGLEKRFERAIVERPPFKLPGGFGGAERSRLKPGAAGKEKGGSDDSAAFKQL